MQAFPHEYSLRSLFFRLHSIASAVSFVQSYTDSCVERISLHTVTLLFILSIRFRRSDRADLVNRRIIFSHNINKRAISSKMNRNDMNTLSSPIGLQNEASERLVPTEEEGWRYQPQSTPCSSSDIGGISKVYSSITPTSSKLHQQPSVISLHDIMATLQPRSNAVIPSFRASEPSPDQQRTRFFLQ